jgi:hypothetical protein
MAGLDDLFTEIAARKQAVPYDPKADELRRLPFHGIPENEMQPDPNNPLYQGWLRNNSTLYHSSPQYNHPGFPWTQISPKIDSHSNMPVVPGRVPQPSDTSRLSYDELGNKYIGLTPDEALANYVGRPAEWLNPDFASSYRPPMPHPGTGPVVDLRQSGLTRLFNALMGR